MIDPLLKAEKKKKKKKMMKLAAEAATQEAPALNGNATKDTDATKKMRKKAKKITEQGMLPPEPDTGAPLGEPDKKKKKKKRKAADAEGQVAEAKPEEEQPADAQAVAPDQKAKKKKSVQQSSEPELAAVGDRELARSGKPIMKALYSEHAAVTALTPAEVDAWRAERDTVVTGCDMKPVMSFDQSGTPPSEHASTLPCNIFLDFCQVENTPVCGVVCALDGASEVRVFFGGAGFSADLLQSTRTFAQPSPIQAQCWPIIQSGRDLVGIAATGSGKTLAFGLPGLKHILAQKAAGVSTGAAACTCTSFVHASWGMKFFVDHLSSEAHMACDCILKCSMPVDTT